MGDEITYDRNAINNKLGLNLSANQGKNPWLSGYGTLSDEEWAGVTSSYKEAMKGYPTATQTGLGDVSAYSYSNMGTTSGTIPETDSYLTLDGNMVSGGSTADRLELDGTITKGQSYAAALPKAYDSDFTPATLAKMDADYVPTTMAESTGEEGSWLDSVWGEKGEFAGLSSDAWGNVMGAGKLGLGVLSYLDQKEYNDEAIAAMKDNRAIAAAEAKATADYRKSYGA